MTANFAHTTTDPIGSSDDDSLTFDICAEEFATDEFRMFEFKIRRCPKRKPHDWTQCPFAHLGERATRRDPRRFAYCGSACTQFKKTGTCSRGDRCTYAHGVFECWLHPEKYKTQMCADVNCCKRPVCFFAHNKNELRMPTGPGVCNTQCRPMPPSQGLPAWRGPSPPVQSTSEDAISMFLHSALHLQAAAPGIDAAQLLSAVLSWQPNPDEEQPHGHGSGAINPVTTQAPPHPMHGWKETGFVAPKGALMPPELEHLNAGLVHGGGGERVYMQNCNGRLQAGGLGQVDGHTGATTAPPLLKPNPWQYNGHTPLTTKDSLNALFAPGQQAGGLEMQSSNASSGWDGMQDGFMERQRAPGTAPHALNSLSSMLLSAAYGPQSSVPEAVSFAPEEHPRSSLGGLFKAGNGMLGAGTGGMHAGGEGLGHMKPVSEGYKEGCAGGGGGMVDDFKSDDKTVRALLDVLPRDLSDVKLTDVTNSGIQAQRHPMLWVPSSP